MHELTQREPKRPSLRQYLMFAFNSKKPLSRGIQNFPDCSRTYTLETAITAMVSSAVCNLLGFFDKDFCLTDRRIVDQATVQRDSAFAISLSLRHRLKYALRLGNLGL